MHNSHSLIKEEPCFMWKTIRKVMNKSIHALSIYGLRSHCSIAALTSCHMFWINCRRITYISLEGRPHWTTARVQSPQGSREWAGNHYAILKFKFPMKLWAISSTVLQSAIAAMLREWALNHGILKSAVITSSLNWNPHFTEKKEEEQKKPHRDWYNKLYSDPGSGRDDCQILL